MNLKTRDAKTNKMKHCVLNMIRMSDWRCVSGLTASDFDKELPTPEAYKAKFPGKNLKEIADELEKTPEDDDLNIEEGRQRIQELLSTRYADITKPRTQPSKRIKPVRLMLKPQHQGRILNVPVRPRPDRDWDRIEKQVEEWAKQGKVVKSTSPWNTPHVVAPKATPPYFRLAQDFRRVNQALQPRKFPVRNIDCIVDELVSKLDRSKFWLTDGLKNASLGSK